MPPHDRALLRAIIAMALLRYLGITAGIFGAIAMGSNIGSAIIDNQPPNGWLWIGLIMAVIGLVVFVLAGSKLRQLKSSRHHSSSR